MKLKLFYLLIAIFGLTSAFTACSDDDDNNAPNDPSGTPTAVVNAFKAKYPTVDYSTVTWEKESTYYVANYSVNNDMKKIEAWFTPAGTWAMTSTDYGKDLFLIPTTINQALSRDGYLTWTMDDIKYYEYPTESNNFYVVEVDQNGQNTTYAYYQEDGTLIKAVTQEVDITPDTTI